MLLLVQSQCHLLPTKDLYLKVNIFTSLNAVFAFSFARTTQCKRKLNAFARSMKRAPKPFLLPIADFHFSSIDKSLCWALNLFLNWHWYLERNGSKHCEICLNMNLPWILAMFDKNTDWSVIAFWTLWVFSEKVQYLLASMLM